MNLIITSEHRVGSRWMHYLLADIYNMRVSGEMGVPTTALDIEKVRTRFNAGRIVKFHHKTYTDILDEVRPYDYKVIGVVRNPRDRAVSLAFHNKYHKQHNYIQKTIANDKNAVKFTVLNHKAYMEDNERMLDMMSTGCSTYNYGNGDGNYIWTCYEWMKEDIEREVLRIIFNLKLEPAINIHEAIKKNSFRTKSKRKPGVEKRNDIWRRKGIVGDFANWFNEDMMEATKDVSMSYWSKLKTEQALTELGY